MDDAANPEYCASLVLTALDNGADGFMFSINQNMLSLLKAMNKKRPKSSLRLYPIVPSAVDFIKLSGQKGMEGLAKEFAKEMLMSGNIKAVLSCLKGLTKNNIESLLSGLLCYEMSEIKSATRKRASLDSVLLHELLTDMALALDLRWLFTFYIAFMSNLKIKPGFQTRNLPFLKRKFNEWNLNVRGIYLVSPFNKVGFQMAPSKEECEQAIAHLNQANNLAINILASGYISIPEAAHYIRSLSNVKGVAVGISKEVHARETFKILQEELNGS
jgi:hypothetical protein